MELALLGSGCDMPPLAIRSPVGDSGLLAIRGVSRECRRGQFGEWEQRKSLQRRAPNRERFWITHS